MPNLPTGTVTFLFTDIEGSTTRWIQHPTAMPSALARHTDLLRHATESHQGYVFQIIGDALCAAFPTALEGVQAALDAQRALRDEPWGQTGPLKVRMALHTGTVEVHAGEYTSGEYASGLTLARTARLLSAGHGGQVLLSQTTRELVERDLPGGVELVDLGEHRLKDLQKPERLYQLAVPDLPSEFPPLQTLDRLPNNLPVQLTSFIGREADLVEVKRLLGATRLLTITGTGGTGKTRLSLAVAADQLDEFADGVWLVELASVADAALVPQVFAGALDVRENPGRPLLTVLTEYLHARQVLLVIDNCEHLIEACARLAEQLLRHCPHLKILTSSREALGIAGEISYRLPSLSLPKPADAVADAGEQHSLGAGQPAHPAGQDSLSTAMRSEAVQLFCERARAIQPRFALTGQNVEAVVRICERLDGIPLALELAAARVGVYAPEQIASRLNDRFRLLTGGSRTAMPRQQTLRAAIDWSYDLLCEDERTLLHGLSVFAGGWTLEAAESIFGSTIDVLDMLPRLVNKSLVIADEQAGQARYRMLETVRQYAREELVKSGQAAHWHDRHLKYYAELAKTAEARIKYLQGLPWAIVLETEHDNMRRALEWGLESHPVLALELAASLWHFWARRGYATEGCRWLEQALSRVDGLPPEETESKRAEQSVRTLALLGLGRLMLVQGENPDLARQKLDEAISLARALGDELSTIYGLAYRALDAIFLSDWNTADTSSAQAVSIARRIQDREALAFATGIRAQFLWRAGLDPEEAIRLHAESIEISDGLGLATEAAGMRYGFGYIAVVRKQYAEARERFSEALRFYQGIGDKQFEVMARAGLADVARLEGNFGEAIPLYVELLATWQKMGHRGAVARVLECLGFVASAQGRAPIPPDVARLKTAAHLLAAGDALRQITHSPMVPEEIVEYARELAILKTALGDALFQAAWAEGHAMNAEQAIAYAGQDLQA